MARKVAITLAIVHFAISAVAATIDKRIITGDAAKSSDFLWMVSIKMENGDHNCGGALLDSTSVLTAAHCMSPGYSVSVKAGSLNQTTGGVDAKIASRKLHPDRPITNLKGQPYELHDIGILKLSTPIERSKSIGYATLPADGSDPAANSTAIIAGWGTQTPDGYLGSAVDKLTQAAVPIRTREDCVKLDPTAGGRDSVVCVGGDGKNVCKFDSGGPLIDQKTGQLIGIASWVIPGPEWEPGRAIQCNQAPSVFTRVGSYIPFITENLGASKQPEQSEQILQDHCGRSGNDKDACLSAARRCTGQVKPDAADQEFLECIDRMQVCADQAFNVDECIANAKVCKEKEKLPLGDVDKLAQCAKENL